MPRSKLAALANYRSLNTGTLGLRNTQPGRALMAEWLAVAADGVVECHPHDQAALQLLLLWKLNGSSVERAPFGYRCRKPRCGLTGSAASKKGFFSCNPLFDNGLAMAHDALAPRSGFAAAAANDDDGAAFDPATKDPEHPYFREWQQWRDAKYGVAPSTAATPPAGPACTGEGALLRCRPAAGAVAKRQGYFAHADFEAHNHPFFATGELFDRGLANAEVPVFHVVTEGRGRPKLQCFKCPRLDQFDRFPGKNFPLLDKHASNAWLVNHKGLVLFYEAGFKAELANKKHACYYSNKYKMKERRRR